ncbi:MAG: glycine--tRNA ligase subunit alpha, partial [Deltaproteobacteria bacterium]|nr:glycine--tRNA ligase subunit alpha [Deltaproteobacteria bacterium]
ADVGMLLQSFDPAEAEYSRLAEPGQVLPAHEYCLKCSHLFNLLEARGAISVAERTRFIARVRSLARAVVLAYLAQREEMGHPLIGRWEDDS